MPAAFVKEAFFPLYNFSFFVKTQVLIGVWINIRVFNSIPSVNISVFLPIQSCFNYCSSVVDLEVRDSDASGSSFVVQDCFDYPGFLVFPCEVE